MSPKKFHINLTSSLNFSDFFYFLENTLKFVTVISGLQIDSFFFFLWSSSSNVYVSAKLAQNSTPS